MKSIRRSKDEEGIPILLAIADGEGRLSAWCPYCAKMHHHGQGDGHRVAHCNDPGSPFQKTGYILKTPVG